MPGVAKEYTQSNYVRPTINTDYHSNFNIIKMILVGNPKVLMI